MVCCHMTKQIGAGCLCNRLTQKNAHLPPDILGVLEPQNLF